MTPLDYDYLQKLLNERSGLTLSADKPEACGPLQVELFALAREDTGHTPDMLGPTRLRPNALGGVLGELFGSVPAWSSGGLNTRV